jgi:gamma-glutamylcyclotransferase (GGCT)/AIG2-like uncharacterized protein YtfP
MPDPGRPDAFFAYGTLQFPEVMRLVVGRTLPAEPAVLEGYGRYLVRGQTFPGLVAEAGSSTPGALYRDLDPDAVARLDRFEDDFYERRTVSVTTGAGARVSAFAYVVPEGRSEMLSREPWDEVRFARQHLVAFLSDRNLDPPPGGGGAATP